MQFDVIINRSGGTVRSIGVEKLRAELEQVVTQTGMQADVRFVEGSELESALTRAVGLDDRAVVVGGGDGTVSTAVRLVSERNRVLGVLPLGTMNLFARALQLPLDPAEALRGLVTGQEIASDLGEVNGRRFAHHVTLGMHPRVARYRERMEYGSRWGKMLASARAWLRMIRRPPLDVYEIQNGEQSKKVSASLIVISNNALGERLGQLPYPDKLQEGLLALYRSSSKDWKEVLELSAAASLGKWESNPHMETETGKSFSLTVSRGRYSIAIDGELELQSGPLALRTLPRALRTLVPVV